MAGNAKIRSGRKSTFVASLMTVLILSVLGVAQFIGLSDGVTFTVVESLAILAGASVLLLETFFEGARQGITERDFTAMDIVGSVVGVGLLITGVSGLAGAVLQTPVIGMPPVFQGVSILLGAGLVAQEIFSE